MASATNKFNIDAAEALQYLIDTGQLDLAGVAADMEKDKKQKILKEHPYPITEGIDGRWRTYIRLDDGKRKQIAKSTYDKVVDALYDYYTEKIVPVRGSEITLESLFPMWLKYKELHAAASTYIRRIESDWNTYYKDTDIVKKPVKTLTKMDFDIWAHSLIVAVNNAKKQYYNVSMIMRQVLDYAVDSEILEDNLFRKVRIDSRQVFDPVKKPPSNTQVFSIKELEKLYDVAWQFFKTGHNTVHKLAPLAVMFQFQTGIRISELCVLKYEDIEDSEIHIQRMYRFEEKELVEYTKGKNAGRYVILTEEAKMLIKTAHEYQQRNKLDTSGYIFSINNQPLSYYSIRKLYERLCEEIGTINKSSHKSRKTYISALIDGGININQIRELVGHADERTTYGSYCYDRKTKDENKEKIENALSMN